MDMEEGGKTSRIVMSMSSVNNSMIVDMDPFYLVIWEEKK